MSNNFVMGFEYEFLTLYSSRKLRADLKKLFGSKASKFGIVEDSSITRDKHSRGMLGWEIVTPPEKESIAEETRSTINKYLLDIGAQTNKSTGFHVNVSCGSKSVMRQMNPEILVASTNDYEIASRFGRQDNGYCLPWVYYVHCLSREVDKWNKRNKTYKKFSLRDEYSKLMWHTYQNIDADECAQGPHQVILSKLDSFKYFSINISKMWCMGYVEYRMIGGSDYIQKDSEIDYAIQQFKNGQNKALSDDESSVEQYLILCKDYK